MPAGHDISYPPIEYLLEVATQWVTLTKTVDEARINTAALANDAALQFAMLANSKYRFRALIYFDTTAAADFKYAIAGPTSPALVRIRREHMIPGAAAGTDNTTVGLDVAYTASTAVVGTGTTGGFVAMTGIIHNGANAGLFAFQFAQNTATNDTGAIVRAGSHLGYAKVA